MSTFIPDEKHRFVLETCVDVPEESPSFPIPLQKVGISGKTVWVSLVNNRGEGNGRAVLTEEDVLEIKKRIASGDMLSHIARDYKMSGASIHGIKSGKRWGHVNIEEGQK